jgi:hypothetical protein
VDALRHDLQEWLIPSAPGRHARGLAYRTAKLLRRRWTWAAVLTLAVGLTLVFTWQLAHERDIALAERLRAESEAQTTRETARLLMSLFTGADPKKMGLPDIPKSIPLAAGRERLQQQMACRPEYASAAADDSGRRVRAHRPPARGGGGLSCRWPICTARRN